MNGRITMAALLLAAAAAPAQADDDALARLYELAEQRTKAVPDPEHDRKSGARSRRGSYQLPGVTVAENPVKSVMHYHRTRDGRLVARCSIEHTAASAGRDWEPRPPKEQR